MALNVKQKYPGTQGGAAQLYASDTRLSLRRREQVFTRLSKSYKENMDISSTSSSSSSNDEVFYCKFSSSRHVSKSTNLIGRIVFDAARQTKKTNLRRLKKNDAFTRAVFRVGVHTHIGALCLVTRR